MLQRLLSMLTLSVAVLAAAGPVHAQQGGRGRGGDQLSLTRLPEPLAERLALKADQKLKLTVIDLKLKSDIDGAARDRQTRGQRISELRMAAQIEAAALLTPNQRRNWEGLAARHREVAGLGRSATALLMVNDLTDDQNARLKALAAATQEKRIELRQSVPANTFEIVRRKLVELETETQVAVKAILTEEQRKPFEAGLAALP